MRVVEHAIIVSNPQVLAQTCTVFATPASVMEAYFSDSCRYMGEVALSGVSGLACRK